MLPSRAFGNTGFLGKKLLMNALKFQIFNAVSINMVMEDPIGPELHILDVSLN